MTTNAKPLNEGTPSSVDLSAVFSSLEIAANKQSIATPSTTLPIDDEQNQVLINALRASLNLGANGDDILFKEMAEAMLRCKLRCISQEKEEVIKNMNQMHIQDENNNQVNNGAYEGQTAEAAACPSIYDSVAFTIPPPDSPWPPTAQKSYPESCKNRGGPVEESTTEKQSNMGPFSAQKSSPTTSIHYTPAPNTAEENLESCINNFMAPVFLTSSAPYTPLPNAEEFQRALLHAQQGISDDAGQNVKTPTFLFKSSSDADDINAKINPDESDMLRSKNNEESTVRTVRFQNGTKVSRSSFLFSPYPCVCSWTPRT
jgi:hypothetical protein